MFSRAGRAKTGNVLVTTGDADHLLRQTLVLRYVYKAVKRIFFSLGTNIPKPSCVCRRFYQSSNIVVRAGTKGRPSRLIHLDVYRQWQWAINRGTSVLAGR